MKGLQNINVALLILLLGVVILGVVNADFSGPTANPPTGDGVLTADAGNVGIGDTTPSYKLDVNGTGRFVGTLTASKIDATTIDPIYNISGNRYATYVASMIGQREEVSGVLEVEGTTVVDFTKQAVGSDLWLFAQITDLGGNFSDMAVLLTPSFSGEVWYEKDIDNLTLTIHATGSGGEVSYRFTAPRFDWRDLPTAISAEGESGLHIEMGPDGRVLLD